MRRATSLVLMVVALVAALPASGRRPTQPDPLPRPALVKPRPELALWVVGDDRDAPRIRRRIAARISARMDLLSPATALLLHAGDSYTDGFWADSDQGRAEALDTWLPLVTRPGVRSVWAPGNHEGEEGLRTLLVEMARRAGSRASGIELPPDPSMPHGPAYGRARFGPLLVIEVSTEDRALLLGGKGAQATWLAASLELARREALLPVVLMHKPPASISCGHHSTSKSLAMWDRVLTGLIDEHGPARGLVIAAHDHDYTRGRVAGSWVGVVVGNSGAPLSVRRPCPKVEVNHTPPRSERRAMEYFGFLECRVSGGALACTELDPSGAPHDSFSVELPPGRGDGGG